MMARRLLPATAIKVCWQYGQGYAYTNCSRTDSSLATPLALSCTSEIDGVILLLSHQVRVCKGCLTLGCSGTKRRLLELGDGKTAVVCWPRA